MMNFMKNFFQKEEPDFTFYDWFGGIFEQDILKVKKSSDFKPPWWENQKEKFSEVKFAKCPGLMDYYQTGWIIPAWADIHIKSNNSGQVVNVSWDRHKIPVYARELQPVLMETDITEGISNFLIPPKQHKIQAPWGIRQKKGMSGILMPAIYHNIKLQDLVVFPGIVDYETYDTVNFIFSVAKPDLEFTIFAGEPLLQVIPLPVGRELTGSVGRATDSEKDKHKTQIPSSARNFYRRNNSVRKKYSIEDRSQGKCPFTS